MANILAETTDAPSLSSLRRSAAAGLLNRATPWLAGAGIAVGHIAVSSNCTIPQQGRCGTCGSCIVAIGSLVAWAMVKKRQGGDFFTDDRSSQA